jgi:FdhD protein
MMIAIDDTRQASVANDPADEPVTGAMVPLSVQRFDGQRLNAAVDWAAEEVAVSFEYNGVGHAVMMASPDALADLGLGFSLSEGIVEHAGELLDLELHAHELGLRIAMRITAKRFAALKQRRRNLAGRTGCGLCGVDTLEQALRPLRALPPRAPAEVALLEPARLNAAMAALDDAQPLRAASGATHAAGWLAFDEAAPLLQAVREDVGRHNALDKTLGALARAGTDSARGGVLLTCRASVEMVQKAVACGVPLLVARSAPTALAVRRAQALGLTLIGFARRGTFVVYANAWRLRAALGQGETR